MQFEQITLPGLDAKRPLVIAGPCSAETEEQVMETARDLASRGVKIFRAGIWKPRTKPGGFEGVGSEGLLWLKKVKAETGMYDRLGVGIDQSGGQSDFDRNVLPCDLFADMLTSGKIDQNRKEKSDQFTQPVFTDRPLDTEKQGIFHSFSSFVTEGTGVCTGPRVG